MFLKDEKTFKSKNKCWLCSKLFARGDNKVKNHDHIAGKYSGSVHQNCIINLKLTKNVPAIFHNLKSFHNHLIMLEISKFDENISVIPDGLEKYMAFTISKI